MMPIEITFQAKMPDDLPKQFEDKVIKMAMHDVGDAWHRDILPIHFEQRAHDRYGYWTRGTKYKKRKERKTGQANDLVYSGRYRDKALHYRRIVETTKSVTVFFRSRVINLKWLGGKANKQRSEYGMNPRMGVDGKQMDKETRALCSEDVEYLKKIFDAAISERYKEMHAEWQERKLRG